MKLLKGLFAIALISMIAVSCTGEKKEADASKENVEVKADADSKENKMAAHVCDENCKEGNCPHHAKMKGHKCDENCTKENCPMMMKMDGKKCADTKCSKDCKIGRAHV